MRDDKSIRGTAAKREVRELRRAFGAEALSVIRDHEDAISTLAAGLHKAQVDLAVLKMEAQHSEAEALADRGNANSEIASARACCQERWDVSCATNKRAFDAIAAFRDRTFMGRLRWVFTGR